MRKMLGYLRTRRTPSARIIITRCEGSSYGIIVDGISSVVSLLPSEIEKQALPGSGRTGGGDFITGVSKQGQVVCGIIEADLMIKYAAGDTSLVMDEGEQGGDHEAAS
jgi:chemotaxis signal transduction protein